MWRKQFYSTCAYGGCSCHLLVCILIRNQSGQFTGSSPCYGLYQGQLLRKYLLNLSVDNCEISVCGSVSKRAGMLIGRTTLLLYSTLLASLGDSLKAAAWGGSVAPDCPAQNCCSLQWCTVLQCTALYCTVLQCTVLYYTLRQCTVLYCTVL